MSGISGLLSNALTGLTAAQQALQVTGNNISNVNTPGYNREQVIQTMATSVNLSGLNLGNGTQIDGVVRSYSAFLQSLVWSTNATASGANTFNGQVQPVVNLLAGTDSGLSTAINQFFVSGVALVAANPGDTASRQAMLSSAAGLVQTFQNAAQQLQTTSNGLNQQISDSVDAINSITQQLAQINSQLQTVSTPGNQPNTMLDQQAQLVTQLSSQIGVSVIYQGNQVNVYTGSGQVLVAANQSFPLQAVPNPYDPQQTDVAYASNPKAIISSIISGGVLGGLLSFRNQVLQPAQNGLGQIADALSAEMNSQQALGLNLNGTSGSAMFSAGSPQVLTDANNTGSAQLSASLVAVSGLTTADYQATYNGAAWTVTNLSTGATAASGAGFPLSFDGLTVSGSGVPGAGDSFKIEPTRFGALNLQTLLTDPRAIAAASPFVSNTGALQNGSLVNTNLGNMTLSAGAYSATSGSAQMSYGTIGSPPSPVQVQITSSGTAGSTVTFSISQAGSAVASGSVVLGTSGSVIAIPYAASGSVGYWTVDLSGSTAVSGDTFTLTPGGAGNGGNAQAMAGLQTATVLGGGTTSLESAYGQLVSRVSNQGNQAQISLNSANAVARQAVASQQSSSGVNLDQEATHLIQFQQAYQAAASAIQIGNKLFDSLLAAI